MLYTLNILPEIENYRSSMLVCLSGRKRQQHFQNQPFFRSLRESN